MKNPEAYNKKDQQAANVEAELTASYISDAGLITDLHNEGFPDFMLVAFIQAAIITDTIVCSRTPGKAGLDLIKNGYDLKGFQIKAKSCDWGPMAGFICQLPFFNKEGYKNVEYNTKELKKYLSSLNAFASTKSELLPLNKFNEDLSRTNITFLDSKHLITADIVYEGLNNVLESWNKVEMTRALARFNALGKSDFTNELYRMFSKEVIENKFATYLKEKTDAKIKNSDLEAANCVSSEIKKYIEDRATLIKNEIVTKYKKKEQVTIGSWSGENSIPTDFFYPFIPLKRLLFNTTEEVFAFLEKTKGINKSTVRRLAGNIAGQIKGVAFNGETIEGATVQVKFLLVQEGKSAIWAIYHGQVQYREQAGLGAWLPYNFQEYEAKEPRLATIGLTPGDYSEDSIGYVNEIFEPKSYGMIPIGEEKYYPLCGLINPHPPYPAPKELVPDAERSKHPDFYKNAVSGDYDLFSFWPLSTQSDVQLIRLSERYLNQSLSLAANASGLFRIDFIPGFDEIRQTHGNSASLKESAEEGNISTLGWQVAGELNAFADLNREYSVNMAFHSDEGGRPGVMEIEFPIALFAPHKLTTVALNNVADTALTGRATISTAGGLIKNAGELVQLLVDINKRTANALYPQYAVDKPLYKIVLQAEWLIHLFFISLSDFNTTAAFNVDEWFKGQEWFSKMKTTLKPDKADKIIEKKIKEFTTIQANHAEAYKPATKFDKALFTKNFKILLQGQLNGSEAVEMPDKTFKLLQEEFLKLAFQNDERAVCRKMRVEALLYKAYLDDYKESLKKPQ